MPVTVLSLGKPVNVQATLQDGGNLAPNTTYYIRIDPMRSTGFWQPPDLRTANAWGMPSDEISFVTTDTKKSADLTWDVLANAYGYKIYMGTSSGSYTRCSHASTSGYVSINSYSITGVLPYGVNSMYGRTWLWNNTLPGGVVNEGERLGIRISGTVSLQDIKDAVVTAGYSDHIYYDGSIFVLRGFIYSRSGDGATTLSERNKVIYLIEGSFASNNSSASFSFGDYSTTEQVGSNGCVIYSIGYIHAFNAFTDGSLVLYGCIIKGKIYGTGTIAYKHYCFTTTVSDYRGAAVEDFTAFNLSTNVSMSNFIIRNVGVFDARSYSGTELDTIYAYNVKIGSRQDNVKNVWVYQNPALCGYSDADFQISDSNSSGSQTTWNLTNAYCLRTDNKPCVWFYVPNNACPTLRMKYEMDVNVKTKDGTAIQGATVILKDKNGDTVFSTTTDGNGDITTQTVISRSGYHDGVAYGSGTQIEWTELGSFSLDISKPGYVAYQGKVSLTEKVAMTIALQDPEIGEREFDIIDLSKETEIIDISTELEVIEL